ncbi:6-phosphogluconolactonase [Phyllobacterium phragmitis]|uniref:6-phosphogluconolactonase n=1 Tax=Phyllobacterium phragmitis TaxID=2670329 RepID=A0A2S9IW54_9HYPH|nr:lactonase family protein [Phyllobacterium phragmitis]PRD44753.1 6-phosphogluconolactonase [Phyllobacterium phragmitis]
MNGRLFLAVGSLNREAPYFQGARGEGLTIYSLDEETFEVKRLASTGSIDNPTFLSVDPRTATIYANSEVFGWHEGTVSAYRFENGEIVYLNKQPTLGSISAHNTISRDGCFLLVANYAMGSGGPDQSLIVLPILADGRLGSPCGSAAHPGAAGHVADRQERSHAHCVVETPQGGAFLVADLGLDEAILYRLTPEGVPQRISSVKLADGAGPRHIAQHANGRFVYIANELDSTVSLIERNGDALALTQTLPTAPRDTETHGADIHLSPDGRFLYCSNRGHDSIAGFAVDQETGRLDPHGHTPSGGKTPRNFAISPDGRLMLVANQNEDCIVIFTRDQETGTLRDTGRRIEIGNPVCVRPFRL